MADLINIQDIKIHDVLLVHRKPYNLSPESLILAPGIRYFTQCFYNHVDIVVNVEGQKWVMGAIAGGFRPHTPLHKWLKEHPVKRDFAVLRAKEYDHDRVNRRILSLGGNPYDWNATLGDGLVDAIKSKYFHTKHDWNEKAQNNERVNCSEAIADIFGLPNSYEATPKHIRDSYVFDTIIITNPEKHGTN